MATFSSPRTRIHLHELSLFRFLYKMLIDGFSFFFLFSFANTFSRIRGEIYLSILITLITHIALNITCHLYGIDSNLKLSCRIKFSMYEATMEIRKCYYMFSREANVYQHTLLSLLKFIRSVFHCFEFFTAHPAKKISYTFHTIHRLLLFYHGAINHV